MILRRITEHVKAQNWFAVGIDFFIVIVGVFIGIQVANWNTEQNTRQEEAAIIERLHEEFEVIQETARALTEEAKATAQTTEDMLNRLVGGDLPEDFETLASLIDGTRPFPPPPPTSSTLSQLLASGEMSFLRSEALRTALTEFNAARDTHVRQDKLFLDVALQLGQDYWQFSEMNAAAAIVDDAELKQSVLASANDPTLIPSLAAVLRQQQSNTVRHSETLVVIENLVSILDDEVSK